MERLENTELEFELSDSGALKLMKNRKTGLNYAGGDPLWRIIYQDGISLEEELLPESGTVDFQRGPDRLTLHYATPQKFEITIGIQLAGTAVCFDAQVNNLSDHLILREFQFPMLKNVPVDAQTELLWSNFGGQTVRDIPKAIQSCHTQYIAQEDKAIEMSTVYPGLRAAFNCLILRNGESGGLYLGSHDPTFQFTTHLLRQRRNGEIDVAFVKYPYLKPGEKTEIRGYRVAPYAGTWHKGADLYKEWAAETFVRPELPASIREFNGWQRIIMRHQYGKVIFRHDELPRILQDGLKAGINTIFMFGWWDCGMDAGYPEYRFDETQGGKEKLREHIREFQQGGGKVILYYNGQLIDMDTDYYRTIGKRISVKGFNGIEHQEKYPFGGDGTALRTFGNKSFVTACPCCQEWHDHLKLLIDRAIELGVDGVFFDQLGLNSRPCFDPTHGHAVPHMAIMHDKAEMLKELRAYLKARRPAMSFGLEWLTDVTAQHVDFVHGILNPADISLEFGHYILPHLVMSDRGIRDDENTEPRLNLAVIRGLRSDVEIYRCRATIAETPHYQAHMAKVNRLRDRYRDTLMNGAFHDRLGAECDRREVVYGVFTATGSLTIALTQNQSDTPLEVHFHVPGAVFRESGSTDGQSRISGSGENVSLNLVRNELVILNFQK